MDRNRYEPVLRAAVLCGAPPAQHRGYRQMRASRAMLVRLSGESVPAGVGDGLGAVANAGLCEEVADVALCGRFRDEA